MPNQYGLQNMMNKVIASIFVAMLAFLAGCSEKPNMTPAETLEIMRAAVQEKNMAKFSEYVDYERLGKFNREKQLSKPMPEPIKKFMEKELEKNLNPEVISWHLINSGRVIKPGDYPNGKIPKMTFKFTPKSDTIQVGEEVWDDGFDLTPDAYKFVKFEAIDGKWKLVEMYY